MKQNRQHGSSQYQQISTTKFGPIHNFPVLVTGPSRDTFSLLRYSPGLMKHFRRPKLPQRMNKQSNCAKALLYQAVLTPCNRNYRNLSNETVTITFAAEFDTPCVTFLMRPPTFPYFISPVTPSETSFRRPIGLPRKSTEPRILAAWLSSSYKRTPRGHSEPVHCRRHIWNSCPLTTTFWAVSHMKRMYC